MKKIIILVLVLFFIFSFGCDEPVTTAELSEQEFKDYIALGLLDEGIIVEEIEAGTNATIVTYTQLTSASEEEIYANWTYILSLTLEAYELSGIEPEEIYVVTNFDDGESLMVSSTPTNIRNFNNGSISTWEFVNNLAMEPLTQGPQIPE